VGPDGRSGSAASATLHCRQGRGFAAAGNVVKLIELLPNFTAELQQACKGLGRLDLIAQLATAELESNSYNFQTQIAQLRLRHKGDDDPTEKVETTQIAPAYEKVALRHRYGVHAETDNTGRLRRLILAHGNDITEALARFSALRQ